ncbi:MAG: RluA family pseudouridine synthase [Planctomycetaceae bacterium]|nr:RluA family pseudouridine synthase [Planctomycetaceae bacterium]
MTESLLILYEDSHCLAVVKHAGLLTQGIPGRESTLEEAVRRHLRPDDPASAYIATVHRLDRPVSGVVVWAKTPKAARRLAAQFADRQAVKEYWAVVEETPGASEPSLDAAGAWDDWVTPPDASGVARAVAPRAPGARRAVTRYQCDRAGRLPPGTAWLRLWPETGRTHQLRAQAAARGAPILGDSTYGSTRPFAPGIALHARALTIEHPILRRAICLVAPLPDAWSEQGIRLPETPVARP